MYYIDSETILDRMSFNMGDDITMILSKLVDFIISDENTINVSKFEGQNIIINKGLNFSEDFSVFLFDDGKTKIYSKLKKIDTNNFYVVEDISKLSGDISMRIPSVNLKKEENGRRVKVLMPFDSTFSFNNNDILDFEITRGGMSKKWGGKYSNAPNGATFLDYFSLFYSDNALVFSCRNESGSANLQHFISPIMVASHENLTELNASSDMWTRDKTEIFVMTDKEIASTGKVNAYNDDVALSIVPRFTRGYFTKTILNTSGAMIKKDMDIKDNRKPFKLEDSKGNIFAVIPVLNAYECYILVGGIGG